MNLHAFLNYYLSNKSLNGVDLRTILSVRAEGNFNIILQIKILKEILKFENDEAVLTVTWLIVKLNKKSLGKIV